MNEKCKYYTKGCEVIDDNLCDELCPYADKIQASSLAKPEQAEGEASAYSLLADAPSRQCIVINFEDLKCCGNCLHRDCISMGNHHEENCKKGYDTGGYEVCDEWKYDGMHKELRKYNYKL